MIELSIDELRKINKIKIGDLKEQALKDGVPFETYLTQRKEYLIEMVLMIARYTSSEDRKFPGMTMQDVVKELRAINSALRFIGRPPPANQITKEMIDLARDTPITTLVEFTRGSTQCINPEHQDKHPSAYLASRINRLICPVCNMSWDAIGIKMNLSGLDFHAAVRSLLNENIDPI